MEKVGALINRLQEQYNGQEHESALLNTALLLVTELQNNNNHTVETTAGTVSIIMPYKPFEIIPGTDVTTNTNDEVDETLIDVVENNIIPGFITEPEAEPQQEPEKIREVNVPEPVQTSASNTLAEERYNDVMEEVPTLAQQQPKVLYELNDTVQPEEQSINDKLKRQVPENAGKLQSEPIKDLRKAIGVNDKYLFIKELFRNDEAAYERSIKTINAFNILPEAEYWIQREMKYKQGWDDSNATVKAFYQLVKRRFA